MKNKMTVVMIKQMEKRSRCAEGDNLGRNAADGLSRIKNHGSLKDFLCNCLMSQKFDLRVCSSSVLSTTTVDWPTR